MQGIYKVHISCILVKTANRMIYTKNDRKNHNKQFTIIIMKINY